MYKWLALTGLLTVAACTDPFIGVPGGKLTGELSETPSSWQTVPDVIQLELRPEAPYSVNIWAVVDRGNLHVATDNSKWVPFIEKNPAVRVRVDGKLYELRAEKITSEEEAKSLVQAYTDKYEYAMSGDWTELDAYRLIPR